MAASTKAAADAVTADRYRERLALYKDLRGWFFEVSHAFERGPGEVHAAVEASQHAVETLRGHGEAGAAKDLERLHKKLLGLAAKPTEVRYKAAVDPVVQHLNRLISPHSPLFADTREIVTP